MSESKVLYNYLYVRDVKSGGGGGPRVPWPLAGDALPLQVFVKRFLALPRGEVDLKPATTKCRSSHFLHGGLRAADLLEKDQRVSAFAVHHHLVYRSERMELHV